jgi:D-xylose transport system substrate-binding protein
VYKRPQAAAALAIYLRAGQTPPSTLVNDTTKDTELNKYIQSVYTTPVWVTTDKVADVIKDSNTTGVGPTAKDVCTGALQSACTQAGIS